MSALLVRARHGLGGVYGPYDDLVAVEATRRLIVSHSRWSIPAMNRLLVESAAHPQAREQLVEELAAFDARWRKTGGDHGADFRLGRAQPAALRPAVDVVGCRLS